jgi:hypothetical protein
VRTISRQYIGDVTKKKAQQEWTGDGPISHLFSNPLMHNGLAALAARGMCATSCGLDIFSPTLLHASRYPLADLGAHRPDQAEEGYLSSLSRRAARGYPSAALREKQFRLL